MTFTIEIVLRESDAAITELLTHPSAPDRWTVDDAGEILKKMLTAIDRAKNPEAPPREILLRGFSWIVEPFDPSAGSGSSRAQSRDDSAHGKVVIALEIPMGAAVAGPFDIDQARLTSLVTQAMGRPSATTSVH